MKLRKLHYYYTTFLLRKAFIMQDLTLFNTDTASVQLFNYNFLLPFNFNLKEVNIYCPLILI